MRNIERNELVRAFFEKDRFATKDPVLMKALGPVNLDPFMVWRPKPQIDVLAPVF